jgi:hypothetical protein
MKAALFGMILLVSTMSTSAAIYNKPIVCEGWGEIQGSIFKQRNKLRLELNSIEDYRTGSPMVGHRACIERKCFPHDPSVSRCEKSRNSIVCTGYGVGNGPELRVEIDLRTREASGTYFNHKAERNVNYPNEYNTYSFERLNCSGL